MSYRNCWHIFSPGLSPTSHYVSRRGPSTAFKPSLPSRKRSFVLPHLDKDSSLLPMVGLLQTPGGWPFAKTN